MRNYIFCDVDICIHNQDKNCTKDLISIVRKVSGEFRSGDRVCYSVCEDFKEVENDE